MRGEPNIPNIDQEKERSVLMIDFGLVGRQALRNYCRCSVSMSSGKRNQVPREKYMYVESQSLKMMDEPRYH